MFGLTEVQCIQKTSKVVEIKGVRGSISASDWDILDVNETKEITMFMLDPKIILGWHL